MKIRNGAQNFQELADFDKNLYIGVARVAEHQFGVQIQKFKMLIKTFEKFN